ncbi:hypothetical protein B484DRAFT_460147 [Ochromonadaceae sp. CCMP2298]|nr:hypothetical protein B484DRAFT_460147 [Ochromonadaceae sp. CCMP2298]
MKRQIKRQPALLCTSTTPTPNCPDDNDDNKMTMMIMMYIYYNVIFYVLLPHNLPGKAVLDVISVYIIWVLLSYQYTLYGFYCHISIHYIGFYIIRTPTWPAGTLRGPLRCGWDSP